MNLRSDFYNCEYKSDRNKEKHSQCLFSENISISDVYKYARTKRLKTKVVLI
jgi:hypothetical protein